MDIQKNIVPISIFLLFFFRDDNRWSLFSFLDSVLSFRNKLVGISDAFSGGCLSLFELIHHVSDIARLHNIDLFLCISNLLSLLSFSLFPLFLLLLSSFLGIFNLFLLKFFLSFLFIFLLFLFLDGINFGLFDLFNSISFCDFFRDFLLLLL